MQFDNLKDRKKLKTFKGMYLCNENTELNYISHIGFGILACSYGIKNLLHLRICIAISNLLLITWALAALPVVSCYSTSGWNFLFFVINAYRAWEVYQNDRSKTPDNEKQIKLKNVSTNKI